MGALRFTTRLENRGPAAAVVLDDDQVAAVGKGGKRFPVVATVNGYTWRTSVARMGPAFTHRKEYARWISEAKREETRQGRVEQAVEMIRAGRTRS